MKHRYGQCDGEAYRSASDKIFDSASEVYS